MGLAQSTRISALDTTEYLRGTTLQHFCSASSSPVRHRTQGLGRCDIKVNRADAPTCRRLTGANSKWRTTSLDAPQYCSPRYIGREQNLSWRTLQTGIITLLHLVFGDRAFSNLAIPQPLSPTRSARVTPHNLIGHVHFRCPLPKADLIIILHVWLGALLPLPLRRYACPQAHPALIRHSRGIQSDDGSWNSATAAQYPRDINQFAADELFSFLVGTACVCEEPALTLGRKRGARGGDRHALK